MSQKAGSKSYYYHHDGLGSVGDVTGNTGTSLIWEEYYPFGLVRQAGTGSQPPTNPFNFTGEQLDGLTGLYHLRARQYDPGTGRFLTTDPVALPITDPYVSAYVYGGNNPALLPDPSGQCPWCIVVGGVVGAVASTVGYAVGTVASGGKLDLGQGLIAAGTGFVAGAACTATAFTTCALGNTAASVVQYQLSPGDKNAFGYLMAGGIGLATARWSYTPAEQLRRAGSPTVNMPWTLQDLIDYGRIFAGGGIRSATVAAGSTWLQGITGQARAASVGSVNGSGK